MEKDAIRNQKVFVELRDVLALQARYIAAQRRADGADQGLESAHERNTLEWVIRTLNLPIEVR